MKVDIYCPCCSMWTEKAKEIHSIQPGYEIEFRCKHCGTEFFIEISYKEDNR